MQIRFVFPPSAQARAGISDKLHLLVVLAFREKGSFLEKSPIASERGRTLGPFSELTGIRSSNLSRWLFCKLGCFIGFWKILGELFLGMFVRACVCVFVLAERKTRFMILLSIDVSEEGRGERGRLDTVYCMKCEILQRRWKCARVLGCLSILH